MTAAAKVLVIGGYGVFGGRLFSCSRTSRD
jgi:hypothetical protein